MSSLFSHIFIPVVILLIFSEKLRIDPKKIILLSPFGVLPDVDIFYDHRAFLHNIFIIIIPLLIFFLLKNRREVSGIICFYLASHIILDLFNGGIYLLYPFYNNVFFARAELFFNGTDSSSMLVYGISKNIVSMTKGKESIVSSENFAILILLIMTASILVMKDIYRKKKGIKI